MLIIISAIRQRFVNSQSIIIITIVTMATSTVLRSSPMFWAAGGWTFFIAENLILSENRTFLIHQLGDTAYHAVYGTLSTIATGSIGYAYLYKIPKNAPPLLWNAAPLPARIAAWAFLSLGASMASQALPKLQIPFAYVNTRPKEETTATPATVEQSLGQWKVQCPFDFTDSKAAGSSSSQEEPHGLDRISRHPGLWSMGFMCLGQASLLASVPRKVWWSFPAIVALVGGAHTDSRYRRGLGGTLSSEYDAKTSNVPFVALIQNGGWTEFASEVKPLNAVLATSVATAYILLRRGGRVPSSVMSAVR